MFLYNLICLFSLLCVTLAQRVAPGVPPQQYQHPPPPPQHQPQYQQVPIQQQVPVQQQYQQHVPVQQQQHVPVQQQQQFQQVPHEQHAQHHPHQVAPGQLLNAANMAHEKEHIAEHLSVPIDTSKMSEQELQFHYFKMHDADNNNMLDGCELIKSLIHWHENDGQDNSEDAKGALTQTDTELEALVDPILLDVDKNQDGFIDYAEFKKSEQSAAPN